MNKNILIGIGLVIVAVLIIFLLYLLIWGPQQKVGPGVDPYRNNIVGNVCSDSSECPGGACVTLLQPGDNGGYTGTGTCKKYPFRGCWWYVYNGQITEGALCTD